MKIFIVCAILLIIFVVRKRNKASAESNAPASIDDYYTTSAYTNTATAPIRVKVEDNQPEIEDLGYTQKTPHCIREKVTSFVAIDFETMTKNPASICAAAFVKVVEGKIVEEYHSLVNPEDNDFRETFTYLHGITRAMIATAPKYPTIHSKLKEMIDEGMPIVCHWIGADIKFMEAIRKRYNLEDLCKTYIDTWKLSNSSLKDACEKYKISLENHHDALCDARACAKLLIKIQECKRQKVLAKIFERKSEGSGIARNLDEAFSYRNLSEYARSTPTENEIINKNTIFYRSTCVITGIFEAWADREELALLLRSLGANVRTVVSGKTSIVVVGYDSGGKRLVDVASRQANGQQIILINEDRLLDILEEAEIEY